jgi:outer membrane biosynthesis protein TonB
MRRALLLPFGLVLWACSSPPTRPATGPTTPPDATTPKGAGPAAGGTKKPAGPDLKAEVGALDAGAVKKNFQAMLQKIERCQDDRRKEEGRLDFLAGDLKIEVHVGEDGAVKSAFLPRSTVGDLRLEACALDAARALSWPRPEGGLTGIASNEFHLPMKGDREATPWEADRVEATLASAALQPCKAGLKGTVELTLYVDTDGKVISAGASRPDPGKPEVAACVTKAVQGLKFPSPGSWPAKVTVPLR